MKQIVHTVEKFIQIPVCMRGGYTWERRKMYVSGIWECVYVYVLSLSSKRRGYQCVASVYVSSMKEGEMYM